MSRNGLALTLGMALALFASESAFAEPLRVSLKERASVTSAVIRLGDLATLSGQPIVATKLASLALGPVPSPGTERRFTRADIHVRLVRAGVQAGDFVFDGARSAHVRGSYLTLSSKRLEKLARAEALAQGWRLGELGTQPAPLALHRADSRGLTLGVEFKDGQRGVRAFVIAKAHGKEVARREVRFSRDPSLPSKARSPKTIARPSPRSRSRQRARGAAGPTLVRAGEPVRVLIREAGISLTMAGIARRSGARGDRVTVRIPSTQRTLVARVYSSGTVVLVSPGAE